MAIITEAEARLAPETSPRLDAFSASPHWLRVAWATFNEIPLGWLTAGAAGVGIVVLGLYFRDVGYWPTDIAALFGLGVAVTVALIAGLSGTSFVILAPVIFARSFGTERPSRRQMAYAQCGAMAALACFLASVNPHLGRGWVAGFGVLAGLFLIATIVSVARRRTQWHSVTVSIFFACVGSVPAASVLLKVVSTGTTAEMPAWLSWIGLLVLLLIFIGVNAQVVSARAHPRLVWAGAVLLTIAMLLSVPSRGFLPRKVAELVGLRLEGQSELRVSGGTCRTILSAVHLVATPSDVARSRGDLADFCHDEANRVTAEVQVRLGSRWLLKVFAVNGARVLDDSPRVTVPDLGTELLLPPTNPLR